LLLIPNRSCIAVLNSRDVMRKPFLGVDTNHFPACSNDVDLKQDLEESGTEESLRNAATCAFAVDMNNLSYSTCCNGLVSWNKTFWSHDSTVSGCVLVAVSPAGCAHKYSPLNCKLLWRPYASLRMSAVYLSRGSMEFLTECNQTAGMDIFAFLIL